MKDSIEVLTGIESQLQKFEKEIWHVEKLGPTIVVFMRVDVGKSLDEDVYHFFQVPSKCTHLLKTAVEGKSMFPVGFFTHKVLNGRVQRIVKAIHCANERKWVIPPTDSEDGKGLTAQQLFEKLLGIQADGFMREIAKNSVQ